MKELEFNAASRLPLSGSGFTTNIENSMTANVKAIIMTGSMA